jgi:hypothetical protein
MIAVFLAGAVGFGAWQRIQFADRYATFIKHCPSLSLDNHFALKTPEGRVVIVSFIEIPESYMPTFCPDRAAFADSRGIAQE